MRAGVRVLLVALLLWIAVSPDVPAAENNQQAERLTFSTGRSVTYLASMLEGENRYDRWGKFRRYVGLFPEWRDHAVFAEVLGAGHSGTQMFASRPARKAMFE